MRSVLDVQLNVHLCLDFLVSHLYSIFGVAVGVAQTSGKVLTDIVIPH